MTVDICDVWSGVDQTKIRSCLNDGCMDTFELNSLIVSSLDFFSFVIVTVISSKIIRCDHVNTGILFLGAIRVVATSLCPPATSDCIPDKEMHLKILN